MNKFVFSYPTKVYFGNESVAQALNIALADVGKTVMLAYGGGSIKKNGIYDIIKELLLNAGKYLMMLLKRRQIKLSQIFLN